MLPMQYFTHQWLAVGAAWWGSAATRRSPPSAAWAWSPLTGSRRASAAASERTPATRSCAATAAACPAEDSPKIFYAVRNRRFSRAEPLMELYQLVTGPSYCLLHFHGEKITLLKQHIFYLFCSTSWPLACTRWVQSTFLSHCSLSTNWLTSALSTIFSSENNLGTLGQLGPEASMLTFVLCLPFIRDKCCHLMLCSMESNQLII